MPNDTDQAFVTQATISGLMEITAGNLALQRAPGFATNEFGAWMVGDHTLVNQQLASLATQEGLTVPTSVDPATQAQINLLAAQPAGIPFERAYLAGEVQGHENTINVFENEIQNGSDPALQAYAQQILPVLQGHFTQAVLLQYNSGAFGSV